jgi:hypothetical protein
MSSSPLIFENFVKVNTVSLNLGNSTAKTNIDTIGKDQGELSNEFSLLSQELAKKEAAINAMLTVKKSLSKLKEFDKVHDELKSMHDSGNLVGLCEILKKTSLSDVLNNKGLIIFNQLYKKFETLLTQIQADIMRGFDIRNPVDLLATQVSVISLSSEQNLTENMSERLWVVAKTQASSIVKQGEIVKSELSTSREEDLVYKLKTDIFERFISNLTAFRTEDLSKNIDSYLQGVARSVEGLKQASLCLETNEVEREMTQLARSEFVSAMKVLLQELRDKLEVIHKTIDYRLVQHEKLSTGVAILIKTLKIAYFDQNPEEGNKVIKHSLFKLIIESYKHKLSQVLKAGRRGT